MAEKLFHCKVECCFNRATQAQSVLKLHSALGNYTSFSNDIPMFSIPFSSETSLSKHLCQIKTAIRLDIPAGEVFMFCFEGLCGGVGGGT